MQAQLIVLLLPDRGIPFLKEKIRHFMASSLQMPYLAVKSRKLESFGRSSTAFKTLSNKILFRALLKVGSVCFVPQKLPVVD
jgi:hypothetical protein